jgi:hypothetical protein
MQDGGPVGPAKGQILTLGVRAISGTLNERVQVRGVRHGKGIGAQPVNSNNKALLLRDSRLPRQKN